MVRLERKLKNGELVFERNGVYFVLTLQDVLAIQIIFEEEGYKELQEELEKENDPTCK